MFLFLRGTIKTRGDKKNPNGRSPSRVSGRGERRKKSTVCKKRSTFKPWVAENRGGKGGVGGRKKKKDQGGRLLILGFPDGGGGRGKVQHGPMANQSPWGAKAGNWSLSNHLQSAFT